MYRGRGYKAERVCVCLLRCNCGSASKMRPELSITRLTGTFVWDSDTIIMSGACQGPAELLTCPRKVSSEWMQAGSRVQR